MSVLLNNFPKIGLREDMSQYRKKDIKIWIRYMLMDGGLAKDVSREDYFKANFSVTATVCISRVKHYISDNVLEGVENGIISLGIEKRPDSIFIEVKGHRDLAYKITEYTFLDKGYGDYSTSSWVIIFLEWISY